MTVIGGENDNKKKNGKEEELKKNIDVSILNNASNNCLNIDDNNKNKKKNI